MLWLLILIIFSSRTMYWSFLASSAANKISLTNLPILLLMLSMLQKKKVNHKVVLKTKLVKDSD